MGYQRPSYRLVWPEGHDLHGLEVRIRGLSIGDLESVAGLTGGEQGLGQVQNVAPLLDLFSRRVVSWNYEDDDGTPVGVSREELAQVDMRALLPIIMTWISEVSNIPDPLSGRSPSGGPFPEVSIPMDVSSPNQMSLHTAS